MKPIYCLIELDRKSLETGKFLSIEVIDNILDNVVSNYLELNGMVLATGSLEWIKEHLELLK